MTIGWRLIARTVLAVSGVAVALAATGGERILYKSVLPGGRVVYGDAPASAATRSERIAVEIHPADSQDSEAGLRSLALTRQQLLRDSAARTARLKQLDKQIIATYGELNAAELLREQGREIQNGDRQGRRILGGFYERQRRLEGAAAQVRQRLDALVRERKALQY